MKMEDAVTEPENLVLEILREMRGEFACLRQEVELNSRKLGAMAESIVGIKRDVAELKADVHALRQDVATLAIAVDEHTHRLGGIEKHLGLAHA